MPGRNITRGSLAGRCLLALIASLLPALAAACGPASPPTHAPTVTASPRPPAATLMPQHGWELPAGEVLFLDHHVSVDGECVKGDCLPGPMIDFPTYRFDRETRILNSWLALELDDDLKVVYGHGMSLNGVAGGGAATGLTEVDTLPAEIQGLRIVQVDRDGAVTLEYGGEVLVLAHGEVWTSATEEVREMGDGQARLTTIDRIVNYGILDKATIEAPEAAP